MMRKDGIDAAMCLLNAFSTVVSFSAFDAAALSLKVLTHCEIKKQVPK